MRRETPTRADQGVSTRWRPGDRDVRGDARALGADRLLRDLDDDLLALAQQRVDLGRLAAVAVAAALAARARGLVVVVGLGRELARLVEVVADVQEGRLLEPDVDERRLHAGQHARHAPEHDGARHAALALALDVELAEDCPARARRRGSHPRWR